MAISYEEAVAKYNDYVVYFPQLVKYQERAVVEFNEDADVEALRDSMDLLEVPSVDDIHQMYIRALGGE
jgi:hypothetical protein